jgi:hypothetical protein
MKTNGAVEVWLHTLISELDGDEGLASRSSRFTPGERTPGTHWAGHWVGPRTGLDVMAKRKIPVLAWNRTPIVLATGSHRHNWAHYNFIQSVDWIQQITQGHGSMEELSEHNNEFLSSIKAGFSGSVEWLPTFKIYPTLWSYWDTADR